jgi:hypothetical protein
LDELNDIAFGPAAETGKDLLCIGNNKRRCLFAVERAKACVIAPRLFQGHMTADHINDAAPAFDFIDYVFTEPHTHILSPFYINHKL